MIIYFANKKAEILGHATSYLRDGYIISGDKKKEDVDSGVSSFSCTISYSKGSRKLLEEMAVAGNYIFIDTDEEELTGNGVINQFYTIIDSDFSVDGQNIYIYAEDAGLDLLNYVCPAVREPIGAKNIAEWLDYFLGGYGWEIGTNEYGLATSKTLTWEGESTATQRVLSIANSFDKCEVSYSFRIRRFTVTNKYINIYKKRGTDKGEQLRLNYNTTNIRIKKSVANLTTAYQASGNTPEGSNVPIDLKGQEFTYQCTGNTYCSGGTITCDPTTGQIRCRKAMTAQKGILDTDGLLVKQYSYSTDSKSELFNMGAAQLKQYCWPEVNYEVSLKSLPADTKVGDTVYLVDDEGEIYIATRILVMEKSETQKTVDITIGDYKIKNSGISGKVQELANKFQEISKSLLYTWVVYSPTKTPTRDQLVLSFVDGSYYIGYAENRRAPLTDINAQVPADPAEILRIFHFTTIDSQEIKNITQYYYVDIDGEIEDPDDIPEDAWTTSFDIDEMNENTQVFSRDVLTIETPDGEELPDIQTPPVKNTALSSTTNKVYAANVLADAAKEAADSAQESADSAKESAESAQQSATAAATQAAEAKTQAQSAATQAAEAKTQAQAAANQAEQAASAASSAGQAASVAQSAAESLVKNSKIIYFASASTTPPTVPADGVEVTNTTDEPNAWTLIVPSWDEDYPYYYEAQQFQQVHIVTVEGQQTVSYSWTTSAAHRNYSITDAQTAIALQRSYFWHDSTGAHVQYEDGYRTDINGVGYTVWHNGIKVAEFGPTGSQIGSETGNRIIQKVVNGETVIQAYNSNNELFYEVTENHVQFGVDLENTLITNDDLEQAKVDVTGETQQWVGQQGFQNAGQVNDAIEDKDTFVFYAYSNSDRGISFTYSDNTLQYRGEYIVIGSKSNPPTAPEIGSDPSIFKWNVNPRYAEKVASNYLIDITGGMKIKSPKLRKEDDSQVDTYLLLEALKLSFWLNATKRASFGYDDLFKAYGMTAENVMLKGKDAALRLDNNQTGTNGGQFILESRQNGHLSLKPGLTSAG